MTSTTYENVSKMTSGFNLEDLIRAYKAMLPEFPKTLVTDNPEQDISSNFYAGSPNWSPKIEMQLREINSWDPNWDSYGAAKINDEIVAKAFKLLIFIGMDNPPEPIVVPVPDGGVDIEWNKESCLLSIKIREEEVRYLLFYRDGTPNQSGKITDDMNLKKLITLWEK